jgi:hypothetical protein
VFSGTLNIGDELLVLGPRYEPATAAAIEEAAGGAGGGGGGGGSGGGGGGGGGGAGGQAHASKAVITSLHLMMGRDLLQVSKWL